MIPISKQNVSRIQQLLDNTVYKNYTVVVQLDGTHAIKLYSENLTHFCNIECTPQGTVVLRSVGPLPFIVAVQQPITMEHLTDSMDTMSGMYKNVADMLALLPPAPPPDWL